MDKVKNKNIITNFKNFFSNNFKLILIIIGLFFISFLLIQTYNFIVTKNIKKTSIIFFESLDSNNKIIEDMKSIEFDNNIYSELSKLKIIQSNNEDGNFNNSIKLYKELLNSNDLEILYKTSISTHAAITLIDASYQNETTNFFLLCKSLSGTIENL